MNVISYVDAGHTIRNILVEPRLSQGETFVEAFHHLVLRMEAGYSMDAEGRDCVPATPLKDHAMNPVAMPGHGAR